VGSHVRWRVVLTRRCTCDATGVGVVGYCWPQSVLPGEPVALHASGDGSSIDVDVVRDRGEPEAVWSTASIRIDAQSLSPTADEDGCGWPVTVTIPTDQAWRSGLYLVRFRRRTAPDADPITAFFVVRAARGASSGCLLVLATNTWNAYNDFGGCNLYTGAITPSFERPLSAGMLAKPEGHGERLVDGGRAYLAYTDDHGLGMWHGMAGWAGQERRFAAWAAHAGIDLDFATNVDVEQHGDLLDGCRLYLSVGHDEYWSWAMRDALDRFVDGGGNVAFLSGNTCYWQVRIEGSRMVCYKHRFTEDPVYGSEQQHLTTTMWADPIVGRPEASLTGVSFTRGGYHRIARSVRRGSGGHEIHRPDHWLLEGTGLARGDLLGAASTTVGYECDGCDLTLRDGVPVATGTGGTPTDLEVVGTAPATPFDKDTTPLPLAPGGAYELEFHAARLFGDDSPPNLARLRNGHAVLGTFQRGGTVVTAGTTEWAYGLADNTVEQVTRNIIERLARPM
jgi:N,N-dimethylformamidase beta subunit-like, C-terminal